MRISETWSYHGEDGGDDNGNDVTADDQWQMPKIYKAKEPSMQFAKPTICSKARASASLRQTKGALSNPPFSRVCLNRSPMRATSSSPSGCINSHEFVIGTDFAGNSAPNIINTAQAFSAKWRPSADLIGKSCKCYQPALTCVLADSGRPSTAEIAVK
jgi:hypothetical protein